MKKTGKRAFSLLIAIFLLVTMLPRLQLPAVAAWEGTCGGTLIWSLNDSGVLTISGNGPMANYSSATDVPWYDQCHTIKTINVTSGVSSIGDHAFSPCTKVTTVVFSGSAPHISQCAFDGISVTAYYLCSNATWTDAVKANYGGSITWTPTHSYASGVCMSCQAKQPAKVLYSGTCGAKAQWQLDEEGTLTISGTGSMYVYSVAAYYPYDPWEDNPAPWYEHRDLIDRVVILSGVTSIGSYAFYGCTGITSVEIPDSVTHIGELAFYNCSGLVDITIPNSVTKLDALAFYGCSSLTSVDIPSSLTQIPNFAFYSCDSLTSVTIPESVTSIAKNAFGRCTSLSSITIPESVTKIGYGAFNWCKSLTSITIPKGVISIADNAFSDCTNLSSVTFLGNAPSIGDSSFFWVTATVYYPCSDETWAGKKQNYEGKLSWTPNHHWGEDEIIHDATCEQDAAITQTCTECGSFNTIYIPGTATGHSYVDGVCTFCHRTNVVTQGTCGPNLFWQLDEDGILSISGTGPMDGYSVPEGSEEPDTPWYEYRELIKKVVMESGVTSIGKLAFYNCANLTEVSIPEGVTEIGSAAFRNCSSLTGITIPEGVTNIGMIVFYDCTALTEVTIGAGVADIGGYAFGKCTALKRITFLGSAPALDSTCFVNVTASIYYPCNDEAWTEAAQQGYGGKPVWKAVHSFGDYNHGQDATCTQDATMTRTCVYCGASDSKSVPNTALGHIEETVPGCAATCTETGLTDGVKCFVCHEILTAQKTILATGHHYADNVCTVCGDTGRNILYSGYCGDNVQYALDDMGTMTISGSGAMKSYYPNTEGGFLIDVPWYHDRALITKVVVEEGVTSIGKNAFLNCYNLVSLTVPDSLTAIEPGAFSSCSNLDFITFLGSAPTEKLSNLPSGEGYHSCTDPSWTDEVENSYSNVTWVGHIFDQYIVTQDATCTQNALALGVCSECGAMESVEVPNTATGHPNCQDGVCMDCGKDINIAVDIWLTYGDIVAWDGPLPYIEIYADGAFLCKAMMNETFLRSYIPYSSNISYTFKWIAGDFNSTSYAEIWLDKKLLSTPFGYLVDDGEVFYTLDGVCVHRYETVTTAATCTEDGIETSTCTLCGRTNEQILPATGHSFGEGVWVTQNTCTQDGQKSYTCDTCGYVKMVTVPATGHDYEITMVPVTCTDYGYELHACQNCDSIFYNQVTPPTGHKYVDGKCECGDVLLQGDITGDGKINMGDVSKLYAAVRGKTQLDEATQPLADLTGDGKINMGDVAKLYRDLRAKDG